MDLGAYFERIDFRGDAKPDFETLRVLHRQHLLHVPYETVDIWLGKRLVLGAEPAFEKIVGRGRGGWCYEQNGLFEWALREIGFEVTRVAGWADGAFHASGNHLLLLVQLEQTYLADVGYADALLEPVPLVAHKFSQDFLEYSLVQGEDELWRFNNHELAGGPWFEFRVEPADEASFARQCEWLQDAPESPFLQVLLATRFSTVGIEQLLGRVRKTITPNGVEGFLLNSGEELDAELRKTFGIVAEGVEALWPRIEARHDELFAGRDPLAKWED